MTDETKSQLPQIMVDALSEIGIEAELLPEALTVRAIKITDPRARKAVQDWLNEYGNELGGDFIHVDAASSPSRDTLVVRDIGYVSPDRLEDEKTAVRQYLQYDILTQKLHFASQVQLYDVDHSIEDKRHGDMYLLKARHETSHEYAEMLREMLKGLGVVTKESVKQAAYRDDKQLMFLAAPEMYTLLILSDEALNTLCNLSDEDFKTRWLEAQQQIDEKRSASRG